MSSGCESEFPHDLCGLLADHSWLGCDVDEVDDWEAGKKGRPHGCSGSITPVGWVEDGADDGDRWHRWMNGWYRYGGSIMAPGQCTMVKSLD